MAKYLINLLIAIDQLATALIGGYPDETLSSYAYRMELQGAPIGKYVRPFIDALFFWEDGHCKDSWESERLRKQFPPELR